MVTRDRKTTRKKSDTSNRVSKERKTGFPESSLADQILPLQRTIGNQAVQRLLKSREMQAELAPSMVIQRKPDPVDISYPVRLIAQPTRNTCWATSLAMLLQYFGEEEGGTTLTERQYEEEFLEFREGRQPLYPVRGVDPAEAARRAGPLFEAAYVDDTTVPHGAYSRMVSQLPLEAEMQDFPPSMQDQKQHMLEYLRDKLQRHGPIAVRIRLQGEAFDHMVVLTGLSGGGTPADTIAFYNDPWPVGGGDYVSERFNQVQWLPAMYVIRRA